MGRTGANVITSSPGVRNHRVEVVDENELASTVSVVGITFGKYITIHWFRSASFRSRISSDEREKHCGISRTTAAQ
jgi:hypothetical protein